MSKFQHLASSLRSQIEGLPVGAPVPSERVLAKEYGVSRMTARRALDELALEGKIVRKVGSGSFVGRPAVSVPLHLMGFTDDMKARGFVPTSVVLHSKVEKADEITAAKLGITPGSSVFYLDRLRIADGVPIAIEHTIINLEIAPGLETIDFAKNSLYQILQNNYGVIFDSGEQKVRAATIRGSDAKRLKVPEGSPVLEFVRTACQHNRIIEVTVSTYPGERFELSAQIMPVTTPEHAVRSALTARY